MAKRYPTLDDVARLLWPLECDFQVRSYPGPKDGTLRFVRVGASPETAGDLVGLLNAARFSWHSGAQQEAPRHFISIPISPKLEG